MARPTMRSLRLAIELRRLREDAGLTREAAAGQVGVSASQMGRIESCKRGIQLDDLGHLLDLYEIAGEQREAMFALARNSRGRRWWHRYGDVIPQWFDVYVGLETEAQDMRTFQIDLIHGLMQTEAYASAVLSTARPNIPSDEVERHVSVRKRRQERVYGDNPLTLWAIIDEAALHKNIGGPAVMREQLDRLVDMASLPNVTLQVLPFDAGSHPSVGCKFTVLGFTAIAQIDLVYMENLTGSLYTDDESEVAVYADAFDHLRAKALATDKSLHLLRRLSRELATTESPEDD